MGLQCFGVFTPSFIKNEAADDCCICCHFGCCLLAYEKTWSFAFWENCSCLAVRLPFKPARGLIYKRLQHGSVCQRIRQKKQQRGRNQTRDFPAKKKTNENSIKNLLAFVSRLKCWKYFFAHKLFINTLHLGLPISLLSAAKQYNIWLYNPILPKRGQLKIVFVT